jgi:hypothetical protein
VQSANHAPALFEIAKLSALALQSPQLGGVCADMGDKSTDSPVVGHGVSGCLVC